ncbi:MAG: hypothetical protein ABEJ67_02935 [Halanaeroarchaeum sp.]
MAFPPLQTADIGGSFVVGGVIVLAGIASVTLAVVGVLAFRRRRTVSYCFVAAALVVLAVKALVGAMTLGGVIGLWSHHVIEHGLDFVMAIMLIAAIYAARRPTDGSLPSERLSR